MVAADLPDASVTTLASFFATEESLAMASAMAPVPLTVRDLMSLAPLATFTLLSRLFVVTTPLSLDMLVSTSTVWASPARFTVPPSASVRLFTKLSSVLVQVAPLERDKFI